MGQKLILNVTWLRSFKNSARLSATFWWNQDETSSKLQDSHGCNLEQPKLHRRRTQHNNGSCGTFSQRKTLDISMYRLGRIDSPRTKSLLAETGKSSVSFMPSSESYDLRKSFTTAQAYADLIWKMAT